MIQKLLRTLILGMGLLFMLLCVIDAQDAFGQTGAFNPDIQPTFQNAGGSGPAALGFVCTYAAGSDVTLRATYQDSALLTVNQNPIRLNAAGRPVNGSTEVSIYLQPLSYRMKIYANGTGNTCNGTTVGALIRSIDNVYDFGQLLAAGLITVTTLNNRQFCVTGANFGAKFTAAAALLPSTGGIVDCSNLQGAQTIASDVFTGQTKPITLVWPTGTAVSSVSLTFPTTMGLDMLQGGILSMAPATTATVNGGMDGTLDQHFTGSGSVVMSSVFIPFAYPEWWGAAGNGTTDDGTALGKSLQSTIPIKLTSVYGFGVAITASMGTNGTIVGTGWGVGLKRLAGFEGNAITLATGASAIRFANFAYDGNRTGASAAGNQFIQGGSNSKVLIDLIYAHDYTDKIINLNGTNNDIWITNSLFVNSFHRGVTSFAGRYGRITGNTFRGMNDSCIDVIDFDDGLIANNTCYADGTVEAVNDGISMNYGDNVTISNNRIYTTTGDGIIALKGDSSRSSGANLNIIGNHVYTSAGTKAAIHITGIYTGFAITSNIIQNGGIYAINSSLGLIGTNELLGQSGAVGGGVTVESSSATATIIHIVGNYIDNPIVAGFQIVAGAGVTTSQVDIRANRVNDITLSAGLDIGVRMSGAGIISSILIEENSILGSASPISGGTSDVQRRHNRFTSGAVSGRAGLTAGTTTVNTSEVEAADSILLSNVVSGGTPGIVNVGAIVAGTSFVIVSSTTADTSTIFWEISH